MREGEKGKGARPSKSRLVNRDSGRRVRRGDAGLKVEGHGLVEKEGRDEEDEERGTLGTDPTRTESLIGEPRFPVVTRILSLVAQSPRPLAIEPHPIVHTCRIGSVQLTLAGVAGGPHLADGARPSLLAERPRARCRKVDGREETVAARFGPATARRAGRARRRRADEG